MLAGHCEVRMPYTNGLERDLAVNTFSWVSNTADNDEAGVTAMFTAFNAAIDNFYNADQAGEPEPNRLSQWLSSRLDRNAVTFRYSLIDLPTGELIRVNEIAGLIQPANSSTSLPFEVAVCCSFRGVQGGPNPARRKGRVFIGPLINSVLETNIPSVYPAPRQAFVDVLVSAGDQLISAGDIDTDEGQLGIWSRTDKVVYPVLSGYVDNAYDTQRRRGNDPSSRTSFAR